MTPKEKAEYLFQRFLPFAESYDNVEDIKRTCKQCAAMAVAEIHMALYEYLKDTDKLQNADYYREFDFWNEVEEEIEKL